MVKKLFVLIVVFCFGMITNSAFAALIAFNDRSAWEAAVSGNFIEEDFSSFTSTVVYEVTPVDVGDFTVSVSGTTFGPSWHNISSTPAGGSAIPPKRRTYR